jgi:hypothetical protein
LGWCSRRHQTNFAGSYPATSNIVNRRDKTILMPFLLLFLLPEQIILLCHAAAPWLFCKSGTR